MILGGELIDELGEAAPEAAVIRIAVEAREDLADPLAGHRLEADLIAASADRSRGLAVALTGSGAGAGPEAIEPRLDLLVVGIGSRQGAHRGRVREPLADARAKVEHLGAAGLGDDHHLRADDRAGEAFEPEACASSVVRSRARWTTGCCPSAAWPVAIALKPRR